MALPPDKRKRAKEIFDRLEELRQAFDKSVRDDPTTVVMTPAEMEGMPEAYLKAQKKDAQGNYVLRPRLPGLRPLPDQREERGGAHAASGSPSRTRAARRT